MTVSFVVGVSPFVNWLSRHGSAHIGRSPAEHTTIAKATIGGIQGILYQ